MFVSTVHVSPTQTLGYKSIYLSVCLLQLVLVHEIFHVILYSVVYGRKHWKPWSGTLCTQTVVRGTPGLWLSGGHHVHSSLIQGEAL